MAEVTVGFGFDIFMNFGGWSMEVLCVLVVVLRVCNILDKESKIFIYIPVIEIHAVSTASLLLVFFRLFGVGLFLGWLS